MTGLVAIHPTHETNGQGTGGTVLTNSPWWWLGTGNFLAVGSRAGAGSIRIEQMILWIARQEAILIGGFWNNWRWLSASTSKPRFRPGRLWPVKFSPSFSISRQASKFRLLEKKKRNQKGHIAFASAILFHNVPLEPAANFPVRGQSAAK